MYFEKIVYNGRLQCEIANDDNTVEKLAQKGVSEYFFYTVHVSEKYLLILSF